MDRLEVIIQFPVLGHTQVSALQMRPRCSVEVKFNHFARYIVPLALKKQMSSYSYSRCQQILYCLQVMINKGEGKILSDSTESCNLCIDQFNLIFNTFVCFFKGFTGSKLLNVYLQKHIQTVKSHALELN